MLEIFNVVTLSLCQINWNLRKPNLFQRHQKNNMNEGKQAILQNPLTEFYANGLIVDHETVKGLMKFLDVYGVEMK